MGEGLLITLAIGALFAPDAIMIARGLEQRSNTNAAMEQTADVKANQIIDGKCVSMLVTCVGDICPYPEILKHAQAGVNARPQDVDPITELAKSSGFYKQCEDYYPMAFKLPQETLYLNEEGIWHHGK